MNKQRIYYFITPRGRNMPQHAPEQVQFKRQQQQRSSIEIEILFSFDPFISPPLPSPSTPSATPLILLNSPKYQIEVNFIIVQIRPFIIHRNPHFHAPSPL